MTSAFYLQRPQHVRAGFTSLERRSEIVGPTFLTADTFVFEKVSLLQTVLVDFNEENGTSESGEIETSPLVCVFMTCNCRTSYYVTESFANSGPLLLEIHCLWKPVRNTLADKRLE